MIPTFGGYDGGEKAKISYDTDELGHLSLILLQKKQAKILVMRICKKITDKTS